MAKTTVSTLAIKIDSETKDRLKRLAEARQRTPHWLMREAIAQYVEWEEAREIFKQEALTSWVACQENGRYLTGKEVRGWLNTWGTKSEKAFPKCRK
jgi:predicted transcriptional regulator